MNWGRRNEVIAVQCAICILDGSQLRSGEANVEERNMCACGALCLCV